MRAYNPVQDTAVGAVENPAVGNVAAPAAVYDKGRGWTITSFLFAVTLLYLVWDWFVLKNKKIEDTISPSNIRANFYNILMITFAAVIGVNLFKVIFVKIAAWNIPVVSWIAEKFVVLFQL